MFCLGKIQVLLLILILVFWNDILFHILLIFFENLHHLLAGVPFYYLFIFFNFIFIIVNFIFYFLFL